jgi:hypothetical protein
LIDKFTRDSRRGTLFKLANFPRAGVDELLLRRGINPDAIDDVKAAIGMVGSPISLADALNYSFERHGAPPAYGVGRFGNGKWPVFYSALEKETCEEEVRHHLGPLSKSCHTLDISNSWRAILTMKFSICAVKRKNIPTW